MHAENLQLVVCMMSLCRATCRHKAGGKLIASSLGSQLSHTTPKGSDGHGRFDAKQKKKVLSDEP